VLTVLTLLALAGLCGWLLVCVRDAMPCGMLMPAATGLAMATPSVGMVVGITAVVMVLVFWWAVTAVMRNEEWIEELRDQRRMPNDECRMPNAECRMPNDECRMTNAGKEPIPQEELRRIVGAMVVETCEARDRLSMVIGCLEGLSERLSESVKSVKSADEGRAA
jgi:hypothetical protein